MNFALNARHFTTSAGLRAVPAAVAPATKDEGPGHVSGTSLHFPLRPLSYRLLNVDTGTLDSKTSTSSSLPWKGSCLGSSGDGAPTCHSGEVPPAQLPNCGNLASLGGKPAAAAG